MAGVGGSVLREDARDIASMMVATGRLVPPHKWVDEMVEAAEASMIEAAF